MKKAIYTLTAAVSMLPFTFIKGQEEKAEVLQCPIIGASFGYVIPDGDMRKMFNPFLQAGVNGTFKTKKNWLFGVDGNFNFGSNNLKQEIRESILKGLYNSGNFIVGTESITTGVVFPEEVDAALIAYNRGFNLSVKGGKLFPVSRKNPNTGVVLMAGLGMIQNQIVYQSTFNGAAQIQGDYAKLYDRKTRGFQLSELIAFWYMSNSNHYMNFYIGLECGQSWSKSVREYQADLKSRDDKKYTDKTYSIKAGWILPIGSRKANEFYFY